MCRDLQRRLNEPTVTADLWIFPVRLTAKAVKRKNRNSVLTRKPLQRSDQETAAAF